MDLTEYIRAIPDFPKPGILFRDITPLLNHPQAFHAVVNEFTEKIKQWKAEAVVGIESRGFIFGAPVAIKLGLPFVPVRKPGKLPAQRMSIEYSLEYGSNQLDIHQDALQRGQRVVIVDDLLATGGTARAAAKLVELIGGEVAGLIFAIELQVLQGYNQLKGYTYHSVMTF